MTCQAEKHTSVVTDYHVSSEEKMLKIDWKKVPDWLID
jgi:hypothetical protein